MSPAKSVVPIPSTKARSTYVELLRKEWHGQSGNAAEPVRREDCDLDEGTLGELLAMGMVSQDPAAPEQVSVVDPGVVEARLGALLRSTALTMLDEARSLTDLLQPLIAESRKSPRPQDGEPIVRIEGKAAISAIVNESVQQATRELFTAQPGGGRPKDTLEKVRIQTAELLGRGVEVRTLYQHTAWHDSPTRQYVADMTALGAQVRTMDELFDRLIVIDRSVAFIPADNERDQAVIIREPAVVRFLVGVFERNWLRAKPFEGSRTPNESSHISGVLRETIIRCLINGDSDTAIAKRIGLSTRAYATHLAKLKSELKAETRFQLGYQLGMLAARSVAEPGDMAGL
ncbi:LuxR family transcriptional regulator [Streptomyces massasporeus]